jgi:hypothetical protein
MLRYKLLPIVILLLCITSCEQDGGSDQGLCECREVRDQVLNGTVVILKTTYQPYEEIGCEFKDQIISEEPFGSDRFLRITIECK